MCKKIFIISHIMIAKLLVFIQGTKITLKIRILKHSIIQAFIIANFGQTYDNIYKLVKPSSRSAQHMLAI